MDKKIVGTNKVILTFISNKSLNGTGFKVKAKLSMLNNINRLFRIYLTKEN